ncbi:MAG: dienelactone hydrolase family protein, partial [Chloroflexi bacterium]
LGHFAENDKWGVTEKKVQKLREKLENQSCTVIFHTYPGTEHWFFEADQPYYNHEAASIAWQRTLDFLEKTLIV